MDLASVVAALASVGVRVSGSTPNNNIQGDSSRACPTGLAGPEPSGTLNDPGQHFQVPSVPSVAVQNPQRNGTQKPLFLSIPNCSCHSLLRMIGFQHAPHDDGMLQSTSNGIRKVLLLDPSHTQKGHFSPPRLV